MKLTRASTYALHAVAFMAQQNSDKPVASHNVAQARGIPERFLLKVLKPLVDKQVLLSIKGPHGGYRLARPASDITMLEILEAVDGDIRGQAPSDQKSNAALNSKLASICNQSADLIKKHLQAVRVSDLVCGIAWEGFAHEPNPMDMEETEAAVLAANSPAEEEVVEAQQTMPAKTTSRRKPIRAKSGI